MDQVIVAQDVGALRRIVMLLHANTPVDFHYRGVQPFVGISRQSWPRARLKQTFRHNVSLHNLNLTNFGNTSLSKQVTIYAHAFMSHDPTLKGNI